MGFLEDLFENSGHKRHHRDNRDGHDNNHGSHDDRSYHDPHDVGYSLPPNNGFAACPSCSQKIASSYKFCPHCGSPSTLSRLCSACKAEVPPQSKFCPACGGKVA
jgi:RNA polymerase subunit RPABC4/transcription elongation factor Spt4